jgi:hypothetical protein
MHTHTRTHTHTLAHTCTHTLTHTYTYTYTALFTDSPFLYPSGKAPFAGLMESIRSAQKTEFERLVAEQEAEVSIFILSSLMSFSASLSLLLFDYYLSVIPLLFKSV